MNKRLKYFPRKCVPSLGITFSSHCRVKPVPCDQMPSLPIRQSQALPTTSEEYHLWVIRRLFKIGGWVRYDSLNPFAEGTSEGSKKVHIDAGTPLPQYFKKTQSNDDHEYDEKKSNNRGLVSIFSWPFSKKKSTSR